MCAVNTEYQRLFYTITKPLLFKRLNRLLQGLASQTLENVAVQLPRLLHNLVGQSDLEHRQHISTSNDP
jgi:hypothetical protein